MNDRDPSSDDPTGWFDPAAGARAFTDVQKLALRAASSVVDQMTSFAGAAGGLRLPRDRANGDRDLRRTRVDAERMIDAYADFARTLLDGFTNLVGGGDDAADPAGTVDRLVVGPVAPGSSANAELWVHNLDARPARDLTFHCSGLTKHDRSPIGAHRILFTPARLTVLAPHSSEGVVVEVQVPPGARPGSYHGLVQATNLPDLCLVVRVDVAVNEDP
jgi:hypothetical protein